MAAASLNAVEVGGLRKEFRARSGRRIAVDGLDLSVAWGEVHGLLGPNGSGKTTTIRMLMGLVYPDQGSISVFGKRVPELIHEVIDRVGAIVEQPKFIPSFSGRRNLELLARATGRPAARVEAVLEQTRLSEFGAERFNSYSLGMKQRLGIAAVLLKEADLIIFDEPTNGLDPTGIKEIRQTIRDLRDQGHTVLVSSHVLAEIQSVATSVSILRRGRVLAAGRIEDVLAKGGSSTLRLRVSDAQAARRTITELGLKVSPHHDSRELLVHSIDEGVTADLVRTLSQNSIDIYDLSVNRPTLEDVFLDITEEA